MEYKYDPYFQGRINDMQTNFLNFSDSMVTSNPECYVFSGNSYSLKKKADEMTAEKMQAYTSIRVNLTGTLVKGNNMCCCWWTIIVGSILIFPLFFMCCNWWKKKINWAYNVENSGYDALLCLIKNSSADELYLMVQDNFFNRSKAEALQEVIQHSKIRNLVFNNTAMGYDADGSNYSDFDQYMRPLKSSVLRSDITWSSKVVLWFW